METNENNSATPKPSTSDESSAGKEMPGRQLFSQLLRDLPEKVSGQTAKNLSAPIAFVCLLHLANEKVSLEEGRFIVQRLERFIEQWLERFIEQWLEHFIERWLERFIVQGLEHFIEQSLERFIEQSFEVFLFTTI